MDGWCPASLTDGQTARAVPSIPSQTDIWTELCPAPARGQTRQRAAALPARQTDRHDGRMGRAVPIRNSQTDRQRWWLDGQSAAHPSLPDRQTDRQLWPAGPRRRELPGLGPPW